MQLHYLRVYFCFYRFLRTTARKWSIWIDRLFWNIWRQRHPIALFHTWYGFCYIEFPFGNYIFLFFRNISFYNGVKWLLGFMTRWWSSTFGKSRIYWPIMFVDYLSVSANIFYLKNCSNFKHFSDYSIAPAGCEPNELGRYRSALLTFLENSVLYTPELILVQLPKESKFFNKIFNNFQT